MKYIIRGDPQERLTAALAEDGERPAKGRDEQGEPCIATDGGWVVAEGHDWRIAYIQYADDYLLDEPLAYSQPSFWDYVRLLEGHREVELALDISDPHDMVLVDGDEEIVRAPHSELTAALADFCNREGLSLE